MLLEFFLFLASCIPLIRKCQIPIFLHVTMSVKIHQKIDKRLKSVGQVLIFTHGIVLAPRSQLFVTVLFQGDDLQEQRLTAAERTFLQ